MEPLVVFGGGLVVYCGYLALMDEICDIKRWYAKRTASSRRRSAASRAMRSVARAVSGRDGGYEGNTRCACAGRLPAPMPR
ncbi:MAG TPA: hypothetical protein VJ161_10550 [Geobacteraceae bacterium]|nr:hypothetical protein [Geobacteraceae bacterium]